MTRVRGTSFLGTIDFVRATFGEEALSRTLDALPESTRSLLGADGHALLPGVWYDAAALSELTRTLDRLLGAGDLALARAAGKHVAFSDISRFFKWLFRLAGPSLLFARAESVWKNYYDQGTYIFEGAEEGRASIRIEGWDAADGVLCKRLEGWIERAFELTLGEKLRPVIQETHHQAVDGSLTPHAYCRFEARWDA
jgi:hypothetical protein